MAGNRIRDDIRRVNRLVAATAVLLVGGLGVWGASARLAGAVVSPGAVVVDGAVKQIQHPLGGVVDAIAVHDGESVRAGQILVRLDDTLTRASLGLVEAQIDEARARQARLIAERDGADTVAFPPELTARRGETALGRAMAGEARLFAARRTSTEGQRSQLRERIAQMAEQIAGQVAQADSKAQEADLIAEEMKGVESLYRRNLTPLQRLIALRRDKVRIEGERGLLVSETARTRGMIAEVRLQILQLDQTFQADLLAELRQIEGRLSELEERRIAAEDELGRTDIRAPEDGVITQTAVHTIGGVVKAGETLMQLVPASADLILETRVTPSDIDQIGVSQATIVKVVAGNQRMTPTLHGTVSYVAADASRDANTGAPFYVVRVTLSADEIRRLAAFKLLPGMAVQVFILTGERTALDFFMKPLLEQTARAFVER